MSVLLVGIGNTLRRDDGVGAAFVRSFMNRDDCRVLVVHQLLPEHCEQLKQHEQVVFVDAAVKTDRVLWKRLNPSEGTPSLGHTGEPSWLLSVCLKVYGHAPEGWLLTIPATDLSYGEGLSPEAVIALGEAIRLFDDQITKCRFATIHFRISSR